ncbi:transcriptional regulator [Labilibacter sediminis]|nr:transcriptional regulator [Labilibacter sediminis]
MRKFFIVYIFLFALISNHTFANIDSLLIKLEHTMEKRDEYDQNKNFRIKQLKSLLNKNSNSKEQQYFINNQIVNEYLTFTLDSALYYLVSNLELAKELNYSELINQCNIKIADVMASTGRAFEAYDILMEVDRPNLDKKLLIEYYKSLIKVFNEVFFYAPLADNYQKYYAQVEIYTDSLIPYLNPESDDYLAILEKKYRDERNLQECKKINTKRLSKTKIGNRNYSLITFERSLLHQLEEDEEMQMRYLILSAISDIQSSVKDNASLTELALILNKKGDIDRAHRFIKFSFDDASFFNSELRFKVISEIFPVINEAYELKSEKQKKKLRLLLVVISGLLLLLLIAIYFIHRQLNTLKQTQKELKIINDRLNDLNQSLADSNKKLNQANDQLFESNHVKEHYIGNFLSICSNYIDKMDQMNKMVNKKIANRKIEELFAETKSQKLIDKEVKEFYENFDDTFLHIFPNFVQELNALLLEEEQVQLKSEERLNTELRVFALIRLGIHDSSKIAKLLRYSVNTIYNYRVKIKNKAKGNRESFEQQVMEIDAVKE